VGKVTVGVGRNLTDKGLTMAESDLLLQNDIAYVTEGLKKFFPWTETLDDARNGVLQNMAFNLGLGGLAEFRNMLGALEQGKWDDAAAEMENSKWAKEVGARASRLAVQIRIGEWQ